MKCLPLLVVACCLTHTSFSSTIHVPADQPTIQAGINAAQAGDTVLVAPGTYTENINFMGKAITVTSSGGPKATIIDGNAAAPVAAFTTSEGPNSVLSRFTLRNGLGTFQFGYNGGGVSISYASPTIEHNVITNNVSLGDGGGIGVYFGSPVLTNNEITKNKTSVGGGIAIGGLSTPGAIVTRNVIEANVVNEFGGGISLDAVGYALIENNTIALNSASGSQGGGIWIVNEADEVIVQNLIFSNSANSGSQIYSSVPQSSTGFRLVNNTIVSTVPAADTAVMADGFNANAIIVNNIIVAAGSEAGILCNPVYKYGPPVVEFNDATSPQGLAYADSCAGFDGTNGNISAGPMFVSKKNFRLRTGSPAINTGTTSAPDLPSKDFANKPRIVNGTIDMGTYESQ